MPQIDTESLINQAIDAKAERDAQRQKLDAQQSSLVQQLGSVGRNRGRYHQLRADIDKLNVAKRELHSQDVQDQKVLDTRVSSAFRNAQMAHKASTDALNLQTAQQAGDVFTGFAKLMSTTKPGTQDFRNGMEALKTQYPLGFASEAVKGHLGPIAQFHDKEAAQNQQNLERKLFTDHGLSPQQFASYTNDRATNVPILDAAGKPPTPEQVEQQRSNTGGTVAADIGGRTYLFKRGLFDNLKSAFRPNQPTDTSEVAQTPEQYAVSQGFRDLNQYNQFIQTGKVVGPEGTAGAPAVQARLQGVQNTLDSRHAVVADKNTPEGAAMIENARQQTAARTKYFDQNPSALTVAGGATASSGGNVQPNLPANLTPTVQPQTATLPPGVPPNQPLQPVVQLGTQPMANSPQVAAQPIATPNPRMELAQRALADPNSTEAHRAAARQILGIKEDNAE